MYEEHNEVDEQIWTEYVQSIRDINKSLKDTYVTMEELAALIEDQEEQITSISLNVNEAEKDVKTSLDTLSNTYNKRSWCQIL